MQDLATIPLTAPEELALKDTQTDEYYEDVMFENLKAEVPGFPLEGGAENKGKNGNDTELIPGAITNTQKTLKALKENPYPGLRPFKIFESNVFFGRKEITFDLITRLANHRFLAVLGASGTGKSSLVRAGLLPGVKSLPGKQGFWKIAICRPGKNPFGNLARAIKKADIAPSYSEIEIWRWLSSSSYGYEELYDSINTPKLFNTLIVIDQFEELFRYRKDYGASGRNDAALFVKMLMDISKLQSLNTYVVITMRSEYLGDCVKFADLAELINEGQFLIPRLKFKQLRDAIIEPGSFSGASIDQAFADKLIGEIGDNMDQLPVLQHALRRSYEEAKLKKIERGGIKVIYQDYKETGLMENALDKHANEIYASFNDHQKKYCKQLFQCITDRATDGRGIRRPLQFSVVLEICKEGLPEGENKSRLGSDLVKVIDSFRQESVNFLMPPPHVAITEETEIDISHESLMRIWKLLQHWIEEEANDAILLDELLQREENDYIKESKLIIYKEWLKRKKPGIHWASLYKPAELAQDSYELKFNEAITLVGRSRKRQNFVRISFVVIATIIFLSIAIASTTTFKNAQLQTKNRELQDAGNTIRETNKQLNHANQDILVKNDYLETAYSKIIDQNAKLASQQAVLTDQQKDLTTQKQELSIKNNELQNKNAWITIQATNLQLENKNKEAALSALRIKEDSLKIVSDSATNLKNLALAIRHSEKSLSIPVNDIKREDIKAHLALIAYQLYLESGKEEDKKLQAQVYSALYFALRNRINMDSSGKDVWRLTPYPYSSDHLAYAAISNSRNNHPVLYLSAEDKNLYSFDLESKTKNAPGIHAQGNKLVRIEAGARGWMAVNTLSNKLLLINNYNQKNTILNLSGIVSSSKFSPDGALLYVYTRDSVLTVFNESGKTISSQKTGFQIEDIAISNAHVFGLTVGGDVVMWDKKKTSLNDPVIIPGLVQNGSVRGTAIRCKPDDGLIIWGNENGQVFYVKDPLAKRAQYLTKFSGPVTNIAFNATYNLVAISSYDKTIQVFKLPDLQSDVPLILNNNEGPVTALFFQKEKQEKESLVSVISPGIIRLYPMELETLACKLNQFYMNRRPATEDLNMYIDKAVKNNKVSITCK